MYCAAPTLKRRHSQILLLAKPYHRIIATIKLLYQLTPLLNTLSCSACPHCLAPLLLGGQTLGNVGVFLNAVAHRALTIRPHTYAVGHRKLDNLANPILT